MTELQELILTELRGYDKPVQRHFLLQSLHVRFNNLSDRAMRREVELMITDEHVPVGSDESGYFFIRTAEDLQKAIQSLDAKIEALCVRKNCLRNNFQEYGRGDNQMVLI